MNELVQQSRKLTVPEFTDEQIAKTAKIALGAAGAAAALTGVWKLMPDSAKGKALSWLATATGGLIKNTSDMTKYFQTAEANKVVVGEALVRSGVGPEMVAAVFAGSANYSQIAASLRSLADRLQTTVDSTRVGLGSSNEDTANDVMRAELIKVLTRAFGSTANARKVQIALATIKSSDFDWFDALKQHI